MYSTVWDNANVFFKKRNRSKLQILLSILDKQLSTIITERITNKLARKPDSYRTTLDHHQAIRTLIENSNYDYNISTLIAFVTTRRRSKGTK